MSPIKRTQVCLCSSSCLRRPSRSWRLELLIPDQFDAGEFAAETALGDLAADPPHRDFTQIATTPYTAFAGVAVHGGVTQRRLRAWNRLTSDTVAAESIHKGIYAER